ncbi:hypothetical protein U9M48_017395 [Paspalum notatum var. saurae]|uniref:L-2-hydroxyglutarate dehydrogenase, mitochondrial n=1 Tax=Paspalum notatum var. saurae TaxID=547442 RepID=A0AAQ3T8S1_PASNO
MLVLRRLAGAGRRRGLAARGLASGAPREAADAVVVGAGVVGLAAARALAMAGREVVVVEAAPSFGTGTSSRNSEVIHAGIYYPPRSLKVRLPSAALPNSSDADMRCKLKCVLVRVPLQSRALGSGTGHTIHGVVDVSMKEISSISHLTLSQLGSLPDVSVKEIHGLSQGSLGFCSSSCEGLETWHHQLSLLSVHLAKRDKNGSDKCCPNDMVSWSPSEP